VPHPRLHERNFALAPLLDVMPEARIEGRPVRDWLREAGREGLTVVEPPGWFDPRSGSR
jgi:7,8-dihydro-6-hydroxymethylpterin-pyrophosphokinase